MFALDDFALRFSHSVSFYLFLSGHSFIFIYFFMNRPPFITPTMSSPSSKRDNIFPAVVFMIPRTPTIKPIQVDKRLPQSPLLPPTHTHATRTHAAHRHSITKARLTVTIIFQSPEARLTIL